MTRVLWLAAIAGVLVVNLGCRTNCNRPFFHRKDEAPKSTFVPPPPPAPLLTQPAPIQQSGGFPVLPPGAITNPPPGANVVPPAGPPSISKSEPERNATLWQPSETKEPALRPESSRDVPPRIQLYAPEAIDKESPPAEKKTALGAFPAIPQFALAKANVYAGLRPPLEGLDWLQANGVQTVVQVRLFGEDDSADRKQVEKRNMRYIPFEVSPVALTKEKTDEFIKLVRDGAQPGIFVYDQDGSLAGAMWYLHLRLGESLDDDASQLRAVPLGLQMNRAGQHREMWLAAQKLLSENSR